MAFNGNGVFQRLYSWAQDAANGILVRSDRMDSEMDGFATGLTDCITRDGQSPPSANLPMGGYKHINVANGVQPTDYAAMNQLTSATATWGGTSTGSSTAYAISIASLPTTNTTGKSVRWIANATNTTTTPTLAMNTAPAATLVKKNGSALAVGEIITGNLYDTTFDGTNWVVLSSLGTLDSLALLSSLSVAGNSAIAGNEAVTGIASAVRFTPTGNNTNPGDGLYRFDSGTQIWSSNGGTLSLNGTTATLTGQNTFDAYLAINKPGASNNLSYLSLQKNGVEGANFRLNAGNTAVQAVASGGTLFLQSPTSVNIAIRDTDITASISMTAPSFVPTGAAGIIGMPMLAKGIAAAYNTNVSGSSLTPCNAAGAATGSTQTGTWKQLGGTASTTDVSLWQRIA